MGDEIFASCDRHIVDIMTRSKYVNEYVQMRKRTVVFLNKFQSRGIQIAWDNSIRVSKPIYFLQYITCLLLPTPKSDAIIWATVFFATVYAGTVYVNKLTDSMQRTAPEAGQIWSPCWICIATNLGLYVRSCNKYAQSITLT